VKKKIFGVHCGIFCVGFHQIEKQELCLYIKRTIRLRHTHKHRFHWLQGLSVKLSTTYINMKGKQTNKKTKRETCERLEKAG